MDYRAVFLSDIHLGSTHSNVDAFLNFLKLNNFDNIYLCGDIFDFLVIKKSFFWSTEFNTVIQKLLRRGRSGVLIYYIPGNHDDLIRKFDGYDFGNIKVLKSGYYCTLGGKVIKITHGDEYDFFIKGRSIIYYLGTMGYGLLLCMNKIFKIFFKNFSLSYYIKRKVKKSFEILTNYREFLLKTVEDEGVDGIISGHTHYAELVMERGKLVGNCGCWMSDVVNTAIVEDYSGNIKLLYVDGRGEIIDEKVFINNG